MYGMLLNLKLRYHDTHNHALVCRISVAKAHIQQTKGIIRILDSCFWPSDEYKWFENNYLRREMSSSLADNDPLCSTASWKLNCLLLVGVVYSVTTVCCNWKQCWVVTLKTVKLTVSVDEIDKVLCNQITKVKTFHFAYCCVCHWQEETTSQSTRTTVEQ